MRSKRASCNLNPQVYFRTSSFQLNRGCLARMTSKVEVAFYMLSKQGHRVQALVRNNAVWFEIDEILLLSWDQMSDFADGLHTFEELKELHRRSQA